jgi:soluble lytic murein transglycosylase
MAHLAVQTTTRLLRAAAVAMAFAAMPGIFTPPVRAEEAPSTPNIILPERKPPVPAAKKGAAPAAQSSAIPTTSVPEISVLMPRDKEIFAQAMRAVAKREWSKAQTLAATSRNPLLRKIVDWAYFREPGPHTGFLERTAFIAANPGWPSANDMRRRAEDVIDDTVPVSALIAWFSANPPLSTAGRVAYAGALRVQGNSEQAHALAREAWIGGTFTRDGERAFLRGFGDILTPEDHWARVDRILYEEQTEAAERLLDRITPDQALLARARIALIKSAHNIDGAVAAVPVALRNDPGLIYDRVRWRRQRDDNAGARALVPAFEVGGPRPDLWWRERHAMAREALAEGNITEAYSLAKHHGSLDALSVSEAEWLAGWIALRFLKDGETALPHFQKVYDSVQTPPSLARGAYWTGRATEALGRPDLAAEWYQRAATYITTYYGQLALNRLKSATAPQLPSDPIATPEERAAFNARELTQALRALLDVDAKLYQRLFAQALADSSGFAVDRQLTSELVNRRNRADLGVVVARAAARDKITLVQYGYPVPAFNYPAAPEKPLILAIARQESNFDKAALSSVGAMGLMQLMPATAKAVAKAAKLKYAQKQLTTDAAYNIRLGSNYLNSLVNNFDGSYILAAASYNAGPNRARQWSRQFGDPRDPAVDAIDWVEQIPFSETRNYVQRIMENLMIYRAILSGTQQIPPTLEAELARPSQQ